MKFLKFGTSILAVLLASPAIAQSMAADDGAMVSGDSADMTNSVDVLNRWNYEPIYHAGVSVDRLMSGVDVYGPDGNEIGGIENVIFSDDGQVQSVIAEVGGFWDIGDTHVNIPWNDVEFSSDSNRLDVPVTEASIDEYTTFPDIVTKGTSEYVRGVNDDLESGVQVFKATDLIGDYARLNDQTPYGYVGDLLITEDGQLEAIVVDAASYGQRGYYAYPYDRGYGVNARSQNLNLPYGAPEVGQIEQFDYDQLTTGRS